MGLVHKIHANEYNWSSRKNNVETILRAFWKSILLYDR